jgi:hypothetical protein
MYDYILRSAGVNHGNYGSIFKLLQIKHVAHSRI